MSDILAGLREQAATLAADLPVKDDAALPVALGPQAELVMDGVIGLDVTPGSVREARWQPSPNHDERPAGVAVDLLVVHYISLPPGRFGGDAIERLFTNRLDADAHAP